MEHDGHTPSTGGDDHLELPPGFRFHPTDEELITHYLAKKVADRGFSARAIGEVDFNKCEPWEFPWRAKMGEKEWFFFSVRDRKYPTGLRTNRATDSGYWKATGKDKEIRGGRSLVGMKKTLVFYLGRAPKGEKSNWIMHEYRLDGKLSCCSSPRWSSEIEWVICRVFRKGLGLSTAMGSASSPAGEPRLTPPLVDVRPGTSASRKTALLPRVFSFDEKIQMEKMVQGFAGPALFPSSAAAHCYSNMPRIPPLDGAMRPPQREGCKAEREGGGSQSQETGLTCEMIPEISSVLSSYEVHRPWFEDHAAPPTDLVLDDCIWN